jgi:hypothetical protein
MAMDQLDYGDYHKFKVSLGVACIIAAFVVPWVFLREPFDLLVEPSQLEKLSDSARSLIHYRQLVVTFLIWIVPFCSLFLLIVGAVLVFRGLREWKTIQHWFDQEQQLKVAKLQKEIHQMTPLEIEQKAEAEVAESEIVETVSSSGGSLELAIKPAERKTAVQRYLSIEGLISERLDQCLRADYQVFKKRRLGKVEYDVILATHSREGFDVVIEIKFAAKAFGRQWVLDNALKIIMATELYTEATKRKAIPVILFVSPHDLLKRKNCEDYITLAQRESHRLNSDLVVHFIAEEDLGTLSCQQIREVISPLPR